MAVRADNKNILNAIRANMSLEYRERIPQATAENIAEIYDNLLNVMPLRNAFVNALVTQIMEQRIETGFFKNPLGVLKRDPMRYGMTEEEIYVNMAKGYQFNQFATVNDLYAYYKSEVMSAYHRITPPMQYAVTVTYDNLRNAFRSETGIRELINAKVQSLFMGAEWDEYLCMKQIFESAYKAGHLYARQISPITDYESGSALTKFIKADVEKMQFPLPMYNVAGATSSATANSLFYITTPEVDAALSVDVLANAFNMEKVALNTKKIIIDKFDNPKVQLIVFDMRFLNVRENFRQLSDSRNGAALTWNYFLTISEMFSYSPFFPVVVYTTEEVGVDSITIKDATYTAGTDVNIELEIAGKAYTPEMVDLSVEGNTSAYTSFIPGSNILHVANDEKANTLTVKATSRYNDTVSTEKVINKA